MRIKREIIVLTSGSKIPANAVYMTSLRRSLGSKEGERVEHYYELHTNLTKRII